MPRDPDDYEFTDPQLAKDYRKLFEQFRKVQGGDFGLGVSDMAARSDGSCGMKNIENGDAQEKEKYRDNKPHVM